MKLCIGALFYRMSTSVMDVSYCRQTIVRMVNAKLSESNALSVISKNNEPTLLVVKDG